ncbi:Ubiquitin carboxyl-terminal hydrolase 43 [Chionoecetes opilio]|uniref:ubiquitinyl hydrolase 1 n=1 Tax=Chionoecetes opilio TaxID=41210 RepID=A0A8J5D0L1_CHIOP|nr:Ubiquitin carboxyl-terminal hydrolase 43 [Chionoecetes opilio]
MEDFLRPPPPQVSPSLPTSKAAPTTPSSKQTGSGAHCRSVLLTPCRSPSLRRRLPAARWERGCAVYSLDVAPPGGRLGWPQTTQLVHLYLLRVTGILRLSVSSVKALNGVQPTTRWISSPKLPAACLCLMVLHPPPLLQTVDTLRRSLSPHTNHLARTLSGLRVCLYSIMTTSVYPLPKYLRRELWLRRHNIVSARIRLGYRPVCRSLSGGQSSLPPPCSCVIAPKPIVFSTTYCTSMSPVRDMLPQGTALTRCAQKKATTLYDLYGVCHHQGTSTWGHYTASCRAMEGGAWHSFSDEVVTECPGNTPSLDGAHLLFYETRE